MQRSVASSGVDLSLQSISCTCGFHFLHLNKFKPDSLVFALVLNSPK